MTRTLRERLAVATVVVAATACAPHPLVERAVRARGGPVGSVVIEAEARVSRAFPGTWRWRRTFASPDRYAWTIFTTGEPLHHLFDGAVVRAFVGGALTAEDPSLTAPLRSQARFVAVMLLDALSAAAMRVEPIESSALPAGMRAGLTVSYPGSDERYTVLLDARLLPVRVEGPIDLSPVGRGRLVARQDDFRPVAGRLLAHHVVWELDGTPLADERVRVACASAETLPSAAFTAPVGLPGCPSPGER
jgi:hypothetical protein